ncbi:MAG: TonB family protein [Gammaproteobacteria bacterium]
MSARRPGRALTMPYALGIALAAHAVLILGISFTAPDGIDKPVTPALEIVLSSDELPEETVDDPDYLGRQDQRGSGNTEDDVDPVLEAAREQVNPFEAEADAADPEPSPASGSEERDLVSSRSEDEDKAILDAEQERPALSPGSRQLLTLTPVARARDPRERFLAVNTRQTLFADYLSSWKDKVERVGTLNFPDAARRLRLEGSPVLEIALRADGSIAEISVRESSGEPTLDEAAIRILKLASPFDPFPRDLREHYSVLRFAYEWRFLEGARPNMGPGDERS